MSEAITHRRTMVMGVVNTTPDSFSDGGVFASPAAAIDQVKQLIDDGADVIDIGGESSRPGAEPVDETLEWSRVEPVLRHVLALPQRPLVSLDTRKPKLMLEAAALGVDFINDIDGFRFGEEIGGQLLTKNAGLRYIAMHKHGDPQSMHLAPLKGKGAVAAVESFMVDTSARLLKSGFSRDAIWLDPGFGFGKDDSATALMFRESKQWSKSHQLCIGVSRKSFFGRMLALENPIDRDPPSKMTEFFLALAGVQMIRTHAVSSLKGLLQLAAEGGFID